MATDPSWFLRGRRGSGRPSRTAGGQHSPGDAATTAGRKR